MGGKWEVVGFEGPWKGAGGLACRPTYLIGSECVGGVIDIDVLCILVSSLAPLSNFCGVLFSWSSISVPTIAIFFFLSI